MKNGIKFLAIDVDGTLTDGGIYISASGHEMKRFNSKDGVAIKELIKSGFPVGIISASFNREIVEQRAKMLGIKHVYVGEQNKLEVAKNWAKKYDFKLDEMAFIGDDKNDLPVMETCGMAVCPADASECVKEVAHIVTERKGGEGCVREFVDGYLNSDEKSK